MTALPYSPASRNHALAVLSEMMRNAQLLGLRPPGSNPCKGLRRRRSDFTETYLTKTQWPKLGQALQKAEEAYPSAVGCLRFLALTSCRKGEALGLRWEVIDGARCLLPETKTGHRMLWIGRPARRLLASFSNSSAYIFEQGQSPLRGHHLDAVWRSVSTDVGLPTLRIHDLHHSYASVAINAGIDLTLVGGLLDHSDLKTSAAYAHLEQSSVKAASHRVGVHLEKAAQTSPAQPRHQSDIFIRFYTSRLSLPKYCAKHQLDPHDFREKLIAWRTAKRGGQVLRPSRS